METVATPLFMECHWQPENYEKFRKFQRQQKHENTYLMSLSRKVLSHYTDPHHYLSLEYQDIKKTHDDDVSTKIFVVC